tara:strand:+ start:516 stop:779 length:264 start_codon:yes stop_codon:yes gene_type:complete
MDVYTEVYTSVEDTDVWQAVEYEVEKAVRTEVSAVIEGHCNDYHDGTTNSGDDISEAVRSALVTLLTNLLAPALGNGSTPSEGDPTT